MPPKRGWFLFGRVGAGVYVPRISLTVLEPSAKGGSICMLVTRPGRWQFSEVLVFQLFVPPMEDRMHMNT